MHLYDDIADHCHGSEMMLMSQLVCCWFVCSRWCWWSRAAEATRCSAADDLYPIAWLLLAVSHLH